MAQIPKPFTGYSSETPSRLVQAFRSLNFLIGTSEYLPALLTEGFGEKALISPATVVTPSSYI